MSTNAGEMLSSEKHAQTIRLELPANGQPITFFLKRNPRVNSRKSWRTLLRFKRPHSDAYREMLLVRNLENSGVPVMRILAWGEERRFGLPERGFILSEGVSGQPLHELFLAGDAVARRRIAAAFGRFVARLHAAGFFQIVRLKDLIASVPDSSTTQTLPLTLIDRAACKTGKKLFWSGFCLRSLRRGFRRMKRDGIIFNTELEQTFAAAYAEVIGKKWKISPRELSAKIKSIDTVQGRTAAQTVANLAVSGLWNVDEINRWIAF